MQRKVLSCGLIFSIQLIVLAFPYKLPNNENKEVHSGDKKNTKSTPCWQSNKYKVLAKCTPCSNSDLMHLDACRETGNKELVKCEKANTTVYKRCHLAASPAKGYFWKFEALTLAGTVVTNVFVWWRRRVLNDAHHRRVKRQMSSAAI